MIHLKFAAKIIIRICILVICVLMSIDAFAADAYWCGHLAILAFVTHVACLICDVAEYYDSTNPDGKDEDK